MRGYGQDYIKSEDIVFPRGEVPIKNEYKPMVISTDVYTHVAWLIISRTRLHVSEDFVSYRWTTAIAHTRDTFRPEVGWRRLRPNPNQWR